MPATTHGMYLSPIYRVWCGMKARCLNKNAHNYHRYGGRGISICEKWLKFEGFIEDMGMRPSSEHTLERLDVNGHYCPENTIWAHRDVQYGNKRNTRMILYHGKLRPAREVFSRTNSVVGYHTFISRLNLGWDPDAAMRHDRIAPIGIRKANPENLRNE